MQPAEGALFEKIRAAAQCMCSKMTETDLVTFAKTFGGDTVSWCAVHNMWQYMNAVEELAGNMHTYVTSVYDIDDEFDQERALSRLRRLTVEFGTEKWFPKKYWERLHAKACTK